MKSLFAFKFSAVLILALVTRPCSALSQSSTKVALVTKNEKVQETPGKASSAPRKETKEQRNLPGLSKGLPSEQMDSLPKQNGLRMGGTGVDGGGGNVVPSEPISLADIKNFVNSSTTKAAIKMRLNDASNFEGLALFKQDPEGFYCQPMPSCWEEAFKDRPILISANNKLFYSKSGRTVFDQIDSARVNVQNDPCFDPVTGQDADASASIEKNQICLSYSRLSQKVSKADLEDRLLVLLIHEYSHLMGTTEEEALAIESNLKEHATLFSYNRFSQMIRSFEYYYSVAFKSHWDSVSSLRKNVRTMNANQVCTRLIDISRKNNLIQETISDHLLDEYYLSLNNIFQYSTAAVLAVKSINNYMFCKSTELAYIVEDMKEDFGDPDTFHLFENLFGPSESVITMKEAGRRLLWFEASPKQYEEALMGNLRKVSDGNRSHLENELDDIMASLQVLRTQYQSLFHTDPVNQSGQVRY